MRSRLAGERVELDWLASGRGSFERTRSLAVLAVCLSFGAACEQKSDGSPPVVTRERSQAVAAKLETRAEASPASTSVTAAEPAPMKKPRQPLCGGRLQSDGPAAPSKAISRRAAAGATEPPERPSFTGGYTWINFWAAWCVPCREEIPRLNAWQAKLSAAGKRFKVVYVSLDDDQRQLDKFLADQPKTGLKSSYWLVEGKERDEWLAAASVGADPELPVHLLIDPSGKIRCQVKGAVEDADYPELVKLIGG